MNDRGSLRPEVSGIVFHRAGHRDLRTGLIGYVSFVLDGAVRIDGVTVRESQDGRRLLSFPAKRSRDGQRHFLVQPIDSAAREVIERQIFDEIGVDPWRLP